MTPAAKGLLVVLGGGATAVGGYEAISYSSGKPGLLFDHSSVAQQPEETNSQTPQQITDTTKVKELLDLIGSLTTNCEIKIWKDNSRAEVNQNIGEENATKLLAKINEIKDTQCKGTSKLLVFKQNTDTGKTWEVISEENQVKELVGSSAFKCTVKIKTADNTAYKDVTESNLGVTLDHLYEKVTALSSECSKDGASNKEIVFQKQSDPSGWSQVETKKQIEDLVGNTSSFKCEVKIKTSASESSVVWSSATLETSDLEKLLTKLKSINNGKCKTSEVSTPKPTLILHKESDSGQTVFSTEEEKIDSWIKKTDGFKDEGKKCVLKIFVSETQNKDWKTENDLEKLHSFLDGNEDIKTLCNSLNTAEPKDIIVQKTGGNWGIYPTAEQVTAFKTSLETNCTIEIKDSAGANDKSITKDLGVVSLSNLFVQLKEAKQKHCTSPSTKSTTVIIKESTNNQWASPEVKSANQQPS